MLPASPGERAVQGLLNRLIPAHAERFVLESIPRDPGGDVFEIESRGDSIVLRGNDGVSLASALSWYLKYSCGAHVGWSGDQLSLPARLPRVPLRVRHVSPFEFRYNFNYCTFGYSMPWWDWERWEREIDWMALNGINAPLALTGQETIWRDVYRQRGFTEAELREFFCGPAYFPWFWMGNLDAWGGPLPDAWFDRAESLQRRILDRQRAFGMRPVLPAFTGHVPPSFERRHPEAKVRRVNWGVGFADTHLLDPSDPLFHEVGTAFLREQIRRYGTDHLYSSDTFNENRPPTPDPEFLGRVGNAVWRSMADVDPDAIWVMQGWIFVNEPDFWKEPQTRALLASAPPGRMLVLDLFCDVTPVWSRTSAFHGQPWVWCVLHNFGGRMNLFGDLEGIANKVWAARSDPARGRLAGIGLTMEAIENNDVVYELAAEQAWRERPVDVRTWLRDYARRRYGARLPGAERAWDLLLRHVYTPGSAGEAGAGVVCARPSLTTGPWGGTTGGHYDPARLVEAWDALLREAHPVRSSEPYRHDLVDVARQVLSNLAHAVHRRMSEAYRRQDEQALVAASDDFLAVLERMDRVLATRTAFLLGKWIADARACGTSLTERNLYERNARMLVTLWGGDSGVLRDYSARQWSGLIGGFYVPRWRMFLDATLDALRSGEDLDGARIDAEIRRWEERWCESRDRYPAAPRGDWLEEARAARRWAEPLLKRYAPKTWPRSLARGKPVTATSVQGEHRPEFAVDGVVSRGSAWWADPWPQSLTVDLERPAEVGRIVLVPYWGDGRVYEYRIEGSLDGSAWHALVDASANAEPASENGHEHRFVATRARFVRVTMLRNSANSGVHIVEVFVYRK